MNSFSLKGSLIKQMTDEEFFTFCSENHDLKIERLSNHQIIINHSNSIFEGPIETSVISQITTWNKKHQLGSCLVRNSKFILHNRSIRIATFAWISTQQLVNHVDNDTHINKRCPDFVLEFKRKHEDLKTSKAKMKEWIANGCKLAWLIDEKKRVIYVFEKSKVRMHIGFDNNVSAEPVLPGFILEFKIVEPNQGVVHSDYLLE